MTVIESPPTAAAHDPVSAPPAPASGAPATVSAPAGFVSDTPKRNVIKPKRDRLMLALSLAAAVGGTLVGAIGFAMSYNTLAKVALSWGFSEDYAPWFPVGVDASIIAFLALDLYLIRKDTRWPMLRLTAHAMTGATIWFNAASQGQITDDPVKAASHGVMPLLFVIGVEAARKLFIKKTKLEAGTHADRIPLHRWVLSPLATPRFYRRMRLYGITSYPEMIRREQDLLAYTQWLKRKYNGALDKATDDERLPMRMAAYGYTVSQALALPEQQEREAEKRAEEAERRRLDAETRRELAQAQAETDRLEAQGRLDAARIRVEGEVGQARAHARAQVGAAERAAAAEEEALETALLAEARARTAQAQREEAEHRKAQSAADLAAAELEEQAAQKRKEITQAEWAAADEARAIETAAAVEARRATAEANRAAAEIERATAETQAATAEAHRKAAAEEARRQESLADVERSKQAAAEAARATAETRAAAAEIETRAVEMEDAAKLTSRQRAVRKVARMALTQAGGDPMQLQLADIQRELAVTSPSTASEYRQEAVTLLAGGYQPGQ
ncbi:DUF2637 domain-containing protein [Actinacidiphila glaucinigra]|uniref:DUF2637 domain-containing protein n=1 Tax=Actinacidiphila glaucinigra TaxID=235986 RepID=UPI0035D88EBC